MKLKLEYRMTKIGELNKTLRYPIAYLNGLEKDEVIHQDDIDRLRAEGRVIEPRKREIRYIPGTTLEPHFSFKNASKNKLISEAVALKIAVNELIKVHTVTKVDKDNAIAKAQKELDDKIKAEEKLIADKVIAEEKKTAEKLRKLNAKIVRKPTAIK